MACWPTPPPHRIPAATGSVPLVYHQRPPPAAAPWWICKRCCGAPSAIRMMCCRCPGFGVENGSPVGPQHIAFRYTPGRFERPKERSQPSSPWKERNKKNRLNQTLREIMFHSLVFRGVPKMDESDNLHLRCMVFRLIKMGIPGPPKTVERKVFQCLENPLVI